MRARLVWLVSAFLFMHANAFLLAQESNNILAQVGGAFAGKQVVRQVQISGNATWYSGGEPDAGSVSLTASTGGASQVLLNLASSGQKMETANGSGSNEVCTWSGENGVTHSLSADTCWKPFLWFLPGFSLQPSLLTNDLLLADYGIGTFGEDVGSYRHLRGNLAPNDLPKTFASKIASESVSDLWLDPTTLLPTALTYSVHPDNGSRTQIALEIRYSDYRQVNGVQVPFHIQRFVNGALQLDVLANSAQAN